MFLEHNEETAHEDAETGARDQEGEEEGDQSEIAVKHFRFPLG